eukprot:114229-Amphidinium_carterae.2
MAAWNEKPWRGSNPYRAASRWRGYVDGLQRVVAMVNMKCHDTYVADLWFMPIIHKDADTAMPIIAKIITESEPIGSFEA